MKRRLAPMSSASHQTVRCPSPGSARPAYRILVVEDHDDIRLLSAKALARAGYEVDTAGDGLSGWEALQTHPYDLLITDNQMPVMSGFDLVQNLRSARMTLPVILASGGLGAQELNQNPWMQPAITLPKPFTTEQMLKTVAEAEALPTSASVLNNVTNPGEIHDPVPAETWRHGESWPHWGINE